MLGTRPAAQKPFYFVLHGPIPELVNPANYLTLLKRNNLIQMNWGVI